MVSATGGVWPMADGRWLTADEVSVRDFNRFNDLMNPTPRRYQSLRLDILPSLLCRVLLLPASPAAYKRRNDRHRRYA